MKKNCGYLREGRMLFPTKLILTMRLTLFFMLIGIMGATAKSFSQQTKLKLDYKSTTIKQILNDIENQSKYDFVYSNNDFDVDREVSITVDDASIQNILNRLLEETGMGYKIVDHVIIIGPKDGSQSLRIEDQQKKISGKVTDSTDAPLPGVTVVVKGTTSGTITDSEGNYNLQSVPGDAILVFSFVGMKSQEIFVADKSSINIVMEEETVGLDEVVAIGYGTIKKSDLTGAISVVNGDELKNVQALSVGDAIQGLVAGVSSRNNGGIGSEPDIKIRGIGSYNNHAPLYVIDGLIATGGIRDLNVQDIESVQVLKDASAASIYGNRAANGVVIIATKNGTPGKTKINFSFKGAMEKLPSLEMMDASEYIYYNDMAYDNAGVERQNHYDNNTDWEKEVLDVGYTQEFNISVSGGGEHNQYFISGNYLDRIGTSLDTKLRRYSMRLNNKATRGIFTIGENLAITDSRDTPASGSPITDVMRMTPDIAVYDDTHPGGYGYGDEARSRTYGTNSVAIQNMLNIHEGNTRIRGDVYGELSLWKFLKYKMSFGYDTSIDDYKELRKMGNWTLNQAEEDSHLFEYRGRYQSFLYDNTITADKKFGNHAINLLIGSSYQKENYNRISGKITDIVRTGDDYLTVLDAGTGDHTVGGYENERYRISYFARMNYNYDGRYLFSSSLRRDASSQFEKGHRVGYFPSVSAGWRISEESFFNLRWLNDLKIRVNYGELGNSYDGYYDYIADLTTNPSVVFGAGDQETTYSGVTQRKLVNTNLTWETKKQVNFGADFAFLQNRLSVSSDYFISKTEDALLAYPILLATGNDGGDPYVNAGSLKNRGFEMELTWKDTKRKFKYNISVNFSKLKNKVIDLPYGDASITETLTKTEEGHSMAMFNLVKTEGIFQNEQEVLGHVNSEGIVIQPNAKPGDIRYVDYDDDGAITQSGDRQYAGSPWPKLEAGFSFNASYRNFDLTVNGFGSFGQKAWDGTRALVESFGDNTNYRKEINPWTETNTHTNFPRVIYGDDRNSVSYIDRWLESSSFLRIQNMTLGYTFNTNGIFGEYIDNLRVAFTAQNLWTITNYKGLDPAFSNSDVLNFGCDYVNYPSPSSYSLSLNINF